MTRIAQQCCSPPLRCKPEGDYCKSHSAVFLRPPFFPSITRNFAQPALSGTPVDSNRRDIFPTRTLVFFFVLFLSFFEFYLIPQICSYHSSIPQLISPNLWSYLPQAAARRQRLPWSLPPLRTWFCWLCSYHLRPWTSRQRQLWSYPSLNEFRQSSAIILFSWGLDLNHHHSQFVLTIGVLTSSWEFLLFEGKTIHFQ